jgi:hypothetical protein
MHFPSWRVDALTCRQEKSRLAPGSFCVSQKRSVLIELVQAPQEVIDVFAKLAG